MGGAQTEIAAATRDVLVEAAEFDPVSIRNTARQLNLHSDSSYRFERRVDPEGLDWASRRCCELILELAGGELAAGVVDVGQPPPQARADRAAVLAVEADSRHRRAGRAGAGDSAGAGERGGRSALIPGPVSQRQADSVPVPRPPSLVPHRRSAELAARPDPRDRPDRRSGPHPRLRGDSRRRERADGPFGPAARRSGAGEDSPRADRRRLRRGADPERGRRADLGVAEPVDRRRAAAEPDAGDPRRRLPSPQPGAEPAGRAADQRGAGQRGDRAVRDRQGVSAARRRVAAGRDHAGHHQRPRLSGRQGRDRGDSRRVEDRPFRWRPATPSMRSARSGRLLPLAAWQRNARLRGPVDVPRRCGSSIFAGRPPWPKSSCRR